MDQTYFQDDWLSHPDYKNWVRKDADRNKAFCSLCHKSLELSNMGTQALKSHMNGKKHKRLAQPLACFFKPPAKKKLNPNPSSMVSPSQLPASNTLVQSIASSDKVKAEIRWAVKSVMSNFSNSSCNDISTLF